LNTGPSGRRIEVARGFDACTLGQLPAVAERVRLGTGNADLSGGALCVFDERPEKGRSRWPMAAGIAPASPHR
jgi:hypothetical protein